MHLSGLIRDEFFAAKPAGHSDAPLFPKPVIGASRHSKAKRAPGPWGLPPYVREGFFAARQGCRKIKKSVTFIELLFK
jgi:hypothetical protein